MTVTALVLALFGNLAGAQKYPFQYAVKFVCGKADERVVAPGTYFTAINIHNPLYDKVPFRVKVAVGLPGFRPGPISPFKDTGLRADEAFEIDCPDIWRLARAPEGRWLKGFVVIESLTELDVVGVYTATDPSGRSIALELERVAARQMQVGLADLIPVPDEQGNFCKRTQDGLIVTVRNQGVVAAPASTVTVDFGIHGMVSAATPPLAPGAQADVIVPIPLGGFDPDLDFRIVVDSTFVVPESNEANNMASGVCIG
jgi:hypothetical protein